jgi:site-specific DNA recombinase
MGRLTLNVLLSFAQFEREVIGERVRDKIAASKRKGLWVGGPIPLGYRCVDKKLEIVPEEAETVRTIFSLYLALGSMGALLAELDRRGIGTKVNGRRDGQKRGGIRFGVGPLAHLLKNRFYIGEVKYRGEVYRGEHELILSRDLFEAVQEKLAGNAVARQLRLRGSSAFLIGRLFDDRGNRMSPTPCSGHPGFSRLEAENVALLHQSALCRFAGFWLERAYPHDPTGLSSGHFGAEGRW